MIERGKKTTYATSEAIFLVLFKHVKIIRPTFANIPTYNGTPRENKEFKFTFIFVGCPIEIIYSRKKREYQITDIFTCDPLQNNQVNTKVMEKQKMNLFSNNILLTLRYNSSMF